MRRVGGETIPVAARPVKSRLAESPADSYSHGVELEEFEFEDAQGRCEQCGVALTEDEVADALEADAASLCLVCAAENGLEVDEAA